MIAIRTLLTLTLLLGVAYPLAVTGLAQLLFQLLDLVADGRLRLVHVLAGLLETAALDRADERAPLIETDLGKHHHLLVYPKTGRRILCPAALYHSCARHMKTMPRCTHFLSLFAQATSCDNNVPDSVRH